MGYFNGLNKAAVLGRLGADPEIRQTTSGSLVANMSVATNYSRKDNFGEWQQETDWHRVTLFEKNAEAAEKYLRKGSQVYVEGRMKTREYEKDGVKHRSFEIVGNSIQIIGPKPDAAAQPASREHQPDGNQRQGAGGAAEDKPFDDDIPF